MKNSFAKIIGATLGVALAIGVAVNANTSGTKPVYASTTSWDLTTASYSSSSTSKVTWTSSYATIDLEKYNSSSNANNYLPGDNDHLRVYKDQKVSFTPASGYQINSITVTAVSSYVSGWTGGSTSNCSVSNSGTAVTVTPTTKTSSCYLTISAAARATAFSVDYQTSGGFEPPASYTVTYNANEGAGTMTDSNSPYVSGSTVTIKNNAFTREGYYFTHWDTKADDTGVDYDEGDTFSISTNTTLYAQWNENLGELVGQTGTINFGSAAGSTSINAAKKYGNDNKGVAWRAQSSGTTSYTQNASYSQIGSSDKPATSINLSATSLGTTYKVTSFSAKFGGFGSTAGSITLKVGNTSVGTGSLSGASDVTVTNSTVVNGSSLSVEVSGIAKGVKVYYVSYTLASIYETQTITASADSAYTDEIITLTTNATSAAWTITGNNTANATLDPASGKSTDVHPGQAGSVTVQAVAAGYTTVTKTVTFSVRPAGPYIIPDEESAGGYSGQNTVMPFTYGNLTGSLNITSDDTEVATVETPSYSAGSGTVQINFVGGGSTYVRFKDGSTVKASVSVTVTASSVTITGLAATDAICIGESVDLGSTITVNAVGTLSDDVIWDSEDNSIAEVTAAGVVTGISVGTVDITVYAYDDLDVYETCTVTVSESNFIRVNKFQNGKKYIIAAEGSSDSSKLFYLPAATVDVDKNPTASLIESFADLTEANCWTAAVTLVEGVQHIVFSNTYEAATYYLVATDTAQGIKIVTAPEEGYWTFDGTGLRYSDGGARYMYTYTDGSFRYYDAEGTGRSLADVFYKYSPSGTAKEAIETNLDTRSTLRYNYGNANDLSTYSNVAIRFGGLISQDLWESLDAESGIQGYGVILSTAAYLNGDTIKELYATSLSLNGGDVDDAMDDLCDPTNIKDFYTSLESKGATHPDEANAAQKGSLVGTHYVWNLYKHVMDSAEGLTESQIKQKLMREYTAIAYIKTTNDGIVFLDETTASVKSIAQAMIDDDTNDLTGESYEGSLGKLAGLTA